MQGGLGGLFGGAFSKGALGAIISPWAGTQQPPAAAWTTPALQASIPSMPLSLSQGDDIIKAAWSPMQGGAVGTGFLRQQASDADDGDDASSFVSAKSSRASSLASSDLDKSIAWPNSSACAPLGRSMSATPESKLIINHSSAAESAPRQQGSMAAPASIPAGPADESSEALCKSVQPQDASRAAFASKLAMFGGDSKVLITPARKGSSDGTRKGRKR